MEYCATMDNDSGYVSHNHESNLESTTENMYKPKETCDIYLSEDALLEQPLLRPENERQWTRNDSFDSVVNSSQESLKTEYSGFEDSDNSFIIPLAKSIMWDSRDYKENISSVRTTPESTLKSTQFSHKVLANVTNTYETNSNAALSKNSFGNKENIEPITTPKKRYENRLTAERTPDIFEEEEESVMAFSEEKLTMKKGSPKENYCPKDIRMVKNVQSLLNGVHPPPSVTTIHIDVTEMLEKLNQNKNFFWSNNSITVEDGKSSLLIDKTESPSLKWPEILKCRDHGLHYNRSKLSEDFEHLCLKYAERFVGAETQSSCTVFDSHPSSSQKRKFSKPKWGSKSPGRRLSHLARRRITFSSANLQANSSSILGSRARQILVDARKLNMLRKSPRKSPRKTPSKSPFKLRKNTPSSSAKKKLAMRFREMSGQLENIVPSSDVGFKFKRVLFGAEKEPSSSFGAPIEKRSTKRALFASPIKHSPIKKSPFKIHALDRKRKRTDSENGNPSKLSRSMSMETHSKKPELNSFLSRTFSESSISRPEELSDQHKKKLQWAVYESLRLQNVTPTHPQYKVFASVLARVTRKFLPSLRFEGRTTEKMFRIARCHSYAVVKGKSVDEIVNEYMKHKLKNQKPQGYVGIDSTGQNVSAGNKENVLQDRANIVESIGKRKEQAGTAPATFSQNSSRIDRIRKVISFEDKDI